MATQTKVENPILRDTILGIEGKLSAPQKEQYLPIVVAGMKLLYDDSTQGVIKDYLKRSKSLKHSAVQGTLKMISIIYKESKGRMAIEMAVPAGVTLLCYVLDYIEDVQGSGVKRTSGDDLAHMTRVLAPETLKLFGIDQQTLAKGIDYGRAHKDEIQRMMERGQPAATAPAAGPPTSPAAGPTPAAIPPAQ